MRASLSGLPGPRGLHRGLLHGLALLLVAALVAVLVATLVGPTRYPASAAGLGSDTTGRPGGPGGPGDPVAPTAPRLDTSYSARSTDGKDLPELPEQCFGPGRQRIEPFPCPLNWQRKGQPVIVLWGDSHAYEWIPALVEAVKGQRVNLVSMVAGSCPPVLIASDPGPYQCKRSNWIAYKYVRQLLRQKTEFKVLLGSNWSGFRRAYRSMYLEAVGGPPTGYVDYTRQMIEMTHEGTPALFDKLGSLGVDVDIIGQSAVVPARREPCAAGDDPYSCDIQRWRAIPEEYSTLLYLQRQQAKILRHGKSRIIDTLPGYCDRDVCHGKIGSIQTFWDDLHISATRTRNLASYFVPAVRALRH